ncbi:hypothetical protein Tsubulata_040893 [Turnera subulata]|uniref:KIB1-4 beta-propeller domain-containing protein n=1 Tax=Turnera subulata TaxID=218843 RepID=A0A9Q0JLJ3_9ROSI|nr:hypothetical protein Tsubulata_040893 [Turnera subulata]
MSTIARFIGRRLLQQPKNAKRTSLGGQFSEALSFSTTTSAAATGGGRGGIHNQSFHSPCLLLQNLFSPLQDHSTSNTIHYFSLKDNKIIEKQRNYWPTEKKYVVPQEAHLIGSSRGWLAYLDLSRDDPFDFDSSTAPVYLTNPSLPVHYTHIVQLGRYCSDVQRIALSSCSPSKKTAMAFLDDTQQIAFRTMDPNVWTCIPYESKQYLDVVYFDKHKRFYGWNDHGLCEEGKLESWDVSGFDQPCAVMKPTFSSLKVKKDTGFSVYDTRYLVESSGELYLVFRYIAQCADEDKNKEKLPDEVLPSCLMPYNTVDFAVYKLNFEKQRWKPVDDLGDRAFFLGRNESFSLSTRDFPYLRRNSIYFAGVKDAGIFNIGEDSIEKLHLGDSASKLPKPEHWLMVDETSLQDSGSVGS